VEREEDWHHRPGTMDMAIVRSLIDELEYGPLGFRGATVVDIGAHIGAFSVLAARGGAARVVAFEPDPASAELCRANVAAHPVVEVRQVALWYRKATIYYGSSSENTGGGSTRGRRMPERFAVPVAAIALDDILSELGGADIVKIDVEGAEYPILLRSRRLTAARMIVGELHWTQRHSPDLVVRTLRAHGFAVKTRAHPANPQQLILFRATRAESAASPP
jgi:FkbM family methyltransferase